jgi:hypothetical protein
MASGLGISPGTLPLKLTVLCGIMEENTAKDLRIFP